MLSCDIFSQGMDELQKHYNKQLSQFAIATWFKYLKERITDEKFVIAVEKCVCTREFMPTAEKFAELVGADIAHPGENWIAYQEGKTNYFALPSTEIVVETMSDEQRVINLQRISEEIAKRKDMKTLRKTVKRERERFEDMRKMLLSGVPWLQREAIAWAKGQECVVLIYSGTPDGSDIPSDMIWEEIEF